MPTEKGRSGPNTTQVVVKHRQLTLGECLAIGRYGPHMFSAGEDEQSLRSILLFIDTIRVCTTCGWSESLHEKVDGLPQDMNVCPQFTRDL